MGNEGGQETPEVDRGTSLLASELAWGARMSMSWGEGEACKYSVASTLYPLRPNMTRTVLALGPGTTGYEGHEPSCSASPSSINPPAAPSCLSGVPPYST